MRADHLVAFFQQIGVDPARLPPGGSEVEDEARYVLNTTLTAANQRAFSAPGLLALQPPFDPALTLTVGASAAPLLSIRPGSWSAQLARDVANIQGAPEGQELTLEIDKPVLLAQLPPAGATCRTLYFLFARRLAIFLDRPLSELSQLLVPIGADATLIVVSDADIRYEGPLLTIAAEARYAGSQIAAPRPPPEMVARVGRYRGTAETLLSWSGAAGRPAEQLTPLHLLLTRRESVAGPVTEVLDRRLWHLALLYTANRSVLLPSALELSFSGPDRTAAALIGLADAPPERSLVVWLAEWPYASEREDADRLIILQSVLARELDAPGAAANAAALVSRLAYLKDQTTWHHQVFVDGQIDKHVLEMRAASDYAAEVAKKIGDAVESLAKGLTEVVLATVAAIVVAVFTPLLKNDFPVAVLVILLLLYAAYLYFFQITYRLASIDESADLLRTESAARLSAFQLALGQPRVGPLVEQVEQRWRLYERWLGATRRRYWGIVAVMVALAIAWPLVLGPGGLGGVLAPTPAATAAPTAPATITVKP
jgi:hypothetical protein